MRAFEIITELRDSSLEYLKKLFPKMPEYVVRDWVYKNFKDDPSELEHFQYMFDMNWKKENIKITIDIFDKETQKVIKKRAGGSKNPHKIPNDAERHTTQRKMLQQGPSKEPIIVIKKGNQYELIEGWHRTIQSLEMWPEGYDQITWIGYK